VDCNIHVGVRGQKTDGQMYAQVRDGWLDNLKAIASTAPCGVHEGGAGKTDRLKYTYYTTFKK